jgi:translation elongation factor EF-Ts
MKPDVHHIETYGHDGKLGVMVELALGTAFTACMPEFRELARDIALQVAGRNPRDVKHLLRQQFAKDDDISVQELVERVSMKLGEPIEVVRFVRWTLESEEDQPPFSSPLGRRAA